MMAKGQEQKREATRRGAKTTKKKKLPQIEPTTDSLSFYLCFSHLWKNIDNLLSLLAPLMLMHHKHEITVPALVDSGGGYVYFVLLGAGILLL